MQLPEAQALIPKVQKTLVVDPMIPKENFTDENHQQRNPNFKTLKEIHVDISYS